MKPTTPLSEKGIKWYRFRTIYRELRKMYKEDRRIQKILRDEGVGAYLKATKK